MVAVQDAYEANARLRGPSWNGISEDAKVYLRMGFKFSEIPRFLKIINLDRISKYLELSART